MGSRFGGDGPRVGGVAASDMPEDPAVDGRDSSIPSIGDGGSRFDVGFLRVGTPSGQVHYERVTSDMCWGATSAETDIPRAGHGCSACTWASFRRTASRLGTRARAETRPTHLDLLATARKASRFAAGILGTLALGTGILSQGGSGCNYVHVRSVRMHLGGVIRVRDIVMGGGGGTGRAGQPG